jgi:biopolymer transport protein ExbB/TolQ
MVRIVKEPDMRAPSWWEGKVNAGNVISWAVILSSTVYMIAFVRADVNALQAFRDETKLEIRLFREQRQSDREALIRMEGDIRAIRQIVEQQARSTTRP